MSAAPFTIARADGRSNAQVIIDLVKDDEPGAIYRYDRLIEVLSSGMKRVYDLRSVQGIVRNSRPRLLRELQRALRNLPGTGYRLVHANEQRSVAMIHTRKSDVQQKTAVQLLQNVRWDEMDANNRQAHQGVLMIVSAIYSQQKGFEKRLRAIEDVIKKNH
jgi:hypothetical protein